MFSTLNLYIARKIFFSILVAFAIITSIIMLIDFVEASRNLDSEANASMVTILYITVLNAPQLVDKTIPFVVLFGVMGALSSLNKHSEIIIMRAAGLSAWRFLKPAIFVTGLIGIVWATAFSPLASFTSRKYDITIHNITNESAQDSIQSNIWLREAVKNGYVSIYAKSADISAHTLYDVTFFYSNFDTNGLTRFTTRYDAKSAELLKNRYWLLREVTINQDGEPSEYFHVLSKETRINWETLRTHSQNNKNPPFWKLPSEIAHAKKSGFSPIPLIMQFHRLLSLPISLIAMAVIAACASLNMSRSGGTLRLLIAGAGLGFGVYFIDNMISAFGETGTLPPILAAWAIPIFVLFLGLATLSKIEDG